MKKLRKPVVYAAMLAIAASLPGQTSNASAETTDTEALAHLATENAIQLCGEITYSGTNVSGEIKAAANAKLPKLLKKAGLEVGASAEADIAAAHYSGPTRKDLPAVITSELNCRIAAQHYLLDALKEAAKDESRKSHPSDISIRSGDVTQTQSQSVVVNNIPTHIPSFTIQERAFGSTPTYDVIPHPDNGIEPTAAAPATWRSYCDDAGHIKAGASMTMELIQGLPRCVGIGAQMTFLAERIDKDHRQAILQSQDLWTPSNTVRSSDGTRVFESAVYLSENGEPIYVRSGQVEYFLKVGAARLPSDGSAPRINVTISRQAKTAIGAEMGPTN